MKKLEIVVRSEKLDDVKSILDECESTGAMVSNIMGYGNQKGYKTTYRGSEYVVNLIPKVKIETIAADDVADKIISRFAREYPQVRSVMVRSSYMMWQMSFVSVQASVERQRSNKHRYPVSFLFLNWQAVAFVHCLFFIVQLCLPVSSADSLGSSLYTT